MTIDLIVGGLAIVALTLAYQSLKDQLRIADLEKRVKELEDARR